MSNCPWQNSLIIKYSGKCFSITKKMLSVSRRNTLVMWWIWLQFSRFQKSLSWANSLQWARVTDKAEKQSYAEKIRIIHRAAALSCLGVKREKLQLKRFVWKCKQVHGTLNEGSRHLDSLGAMEHPNDDNFIKSSTGGSTFSKAFTLAYTSHISCLLASHMKQTFSLKGRSTKVLQVKPCDVCALPCDWKSNPWGKLDFLWSFDAGVSGLRAKRDMQPLTNVLKENSMKACLAKSYGKANTGSRTAVTKQWRVVSGP